MNNGCRYIVLPTACKCSLFFFVLFFQVILLSKDKGIIIKTLYTKGFWRMTIKMKWAAPMNVNGTHFLLQTFLDLKLHCRLIFYLSSVDRLKYISNVIRHSMSMPEDNSKNFSYPLSQYTHNGKRQSASLSISMSIRWN